jgi:hypothetical protein
MKADREKKKFSKYTVPIIFTCVTSYEVEALSKDEAIERVRVMVEDGFEPMYKDGSTRIIPDFDVLSSDVKEG